MDGMKFPFSMRQIQNGQETAVITVAEYKFNTYLEESLFESAVQPDAEKWERKTYEDGPIVYFRR